MEPQSTGIYKIENKINGKIYIGQSIHIERRWKEHINPKNFINPTKVLYQAMNEYGLSNFSFTIIEECEKEELLAREKYYIQKYNSIYPNGYNMQLGLNYRKSFSEEVISGVKQDLIENKLNRKQISEKWGISPCYVSNINSGDLRRDNLLSYPLRPIQYHSKNGHHCIDCGVEITSSAKRCNKCSKRILRKAERPSREELKQMIRTMPFTEIAKKYGVSDNAIRKWCKYFNLPSRKKDINAYSDEEWEKL